MLYRNDEAVKWLEDKDEKEGLYDRIDRWAVYSDHIILGYIDYYAGRRLRKYTAPIFEYKDAGQGCYCEGKKPEELGHHLPSRKRNFGCVCGNVAYTDKTCEEHPIPSVDSRWVRENWSPDDLAYMEISSPQL